MSNLRVKIKIYVKFKDQSIFMREKNLVHMFSHICDLPFCSHQNKSSDFLQQVEKSKSNFQDLKVQMKNHISLNGSNNRKLISKIMIKHLEILNDTQTLMSKIIKIFFIENINCIFLISIVFFFKWFICFKIYSLKLCVI